jgi:ABC-type transport system involved in multi-copper enzyme maturation permease subunit
MYVPRSKTREIDMMVARPISRASLVLSFAIGFALVALLLVLPVVLGLYFLGVLSQTGFWVYAVSLLAEAWLVVAIALFCALIMKSGTVAILSALRCISCHG